MKTTPRHQQGMTLIELMIAMVISLALLGGLSEVYLGSKQSYNLVEESSRLQENGRFATDILTREIRGAGFFGCLRAPDDQTLLNHIDSTDEQYQFGEVLIGFDDKQLDGTDSTSDSISFSSAFDRDINITGKQNQASANIKVNADSGLAVDDIILISDCTNGDVFQITSGNPDNNGTVVHNTGTGTPGNAKLPGISGCPGGNAHCLSKAYDMDAKLYKIGRIGFDIQPGANGNNGLFRTDANGTATEIIENVENMQILYGEDTDLDRFHVPNQYVNATDIGYVSNAIPGNIGNAVTVRIALLLKGERLLLPATTAQNHQLLDTVIATNDQLLYRTFTTTITIRNRALIDSL